MENRNGTNGNLGTKSDADTIEKQRRERVLSWVCRLADHFHVELIEHEVKSYVIALARLPQPTLHVVFRKCLETWGKVHDMPPIVFLLDLAAKYHSTVEQELTSAARWGDEEAKQIL